MPTYEYQCDACKHRFDEWQSFQDAELTKCPKCKKKLRRLLGAGAAIIFKGSGFYETDYRSESYKSGEKAEAPKTETKEPDAKPESKPESKPEAKTESKPAKRKAKGDAN